MMQLNSFPITTRNAVKNHKKVLKQEEKVIKKLRRAEKKAFHMKTWNDSEDSNYKENEKLERIVKTVNSHRIQTYDHRWTPIL